MPIYEYECPKCGNVFEEWGKAADSHKDEPCPKCGAPSPRIISRTSFVLKGDGWYVSDYGYRKGISEDSGGKADVPLPATPNKPAKQGEKALAKVPETKASEPAKGAETPKAAASKATPAKKSEKSASDNASSSSTTASTDKAKS